MKKLRVGAQRAADHLLISVLSFLIPRQGRRAVFLISVFFEIAAISDEHRKMVGDLNKRLKLVDDPEALSGPTLIAERLTKDQQLTLRDLHKDMTEDEIFGMCTRILQTRDRWARYSDNYNQIYKETMSVIREAIQLLDEEKV